MANISDRAASALGVLGDPTRRTIFERIAAEPRPVNRLAAGLPVSRSAVSQHLRILKEAGLVTEAVSGTRRIYRLDPRGIGLVRDWLDQHWSAALSNFKVFADEISEEEEGQTR